MSAHVIPIYSAMPHFPIQPDLHFRDPIEHAVEHVQIALADYAFAIRAASDPERARAIRRQIEGRIAELTDASNMALDREINLEAKENAAVDRIIADLQRMAKE